MLYTEFMDKVKALTLEIDDKTGNLYVRPDAGYVLANSGLTLADVYDFPGVTMADVYRHLDLECQRDRALRDYVPLIGKMFYDMGTQIADQSATEEENQMLKDLLDYRKMKGEQMKAEEEKEKTPVEEMRKLGFLMEKKKP